MEGTITLSIPTMCCFFFFFRLMSHVFLCVFFSHSQAINRVSKPRTLTPLGWLVRKTWTQTNNKPRTLLFPYFPKSLFKLMGEVCSPSNAYFLWTSDYTPFNLLPCLSVWTFLIWSLCTSTLWFSEILFWYVDLRLTLLVTCRPLFIGNQGNVENYVFMATANRLWLFHLG